MPLRFLVRSANLLEEGEACWAQPKPSMLVTTSAQASDLVRRRLSALPLPDKKLTFLSWERLSKEFFSKTADEIYIFVVETYTPYVCTSAHTTCTHLTPAHLHTLLSYILFLHVCTAAHKHTLHPHILHLYILRLHIFTPSHLTSAPLHILHPLFSLVLPLSSLSARLIKWWLNMPVVSIGNGFFQSQDSRKWKDTEKQKSKDMNKCKTSGKHVLFKQ